MKAIKLLAFVFLLFGLQGCYTVIWTPDIDFPTKENSDDSESYYEEPYYGDYTPYYGLPWWYTVPPTTFTPLVKERSKEVTKLRNGSEPGRGNPDRPIIIERMPHDGGSTTSPVIDTPPPTVSQPVTGEDAASKKTESTPPQRDRTNSSNSRDTRNNDGSRSSDTPRR
ncbi:MAG: hypothetical protein Q8K40_02895 [Ignavibacteria bacterium]|nr:hypothetical protein [Ignavibacteria bacterium]